MSWNKTAFMSWVQMMGFFCESRRSSDTQLNFPFNLLGLENERPYHIESCLKRHSNFHGN